VDVYDADTTPDARMWRSLGEHQALVLVADYHRRCRPHPRAGNQRLHNLTHVVVENQIAMGDEFPAAAKLEELIAEGLSRHEAVHAIGSVFAGQLYGALSETAPKRIGREEDYRESLNALTAQSWRDAFVDDVPFAHPESEEIDDAIRSARHFRERSPEELLDPGLDPDEARDPEAVVMALDLPSPLFPREAIMAAREHGDAVVEGLIDLIDEAFSFAENGGYPEGNGHLFACLLLAEMKAAPGFAAVSKLFSRSEEDCAALGDDFVTEDLGRVLASFPNAGLSEMSAIIADESRSPYARAAGVTGIATLVADDRLDRQEAISCLHHLFSSLPEDDEEVYLDVVNVLLHLHAEQAFDDIREAMRSGRISPRDMGVDEVTRAEQLGLDGCMQELRASRQYRTVKDTIAETSWWACFDPAELDEDDEELMLAIDVEDDDIEYSLGEGELGQWDSPDATTVRRSVPKVGRNDPCPCGSGKKHKKCCGK